MIRFKFSIANSLSFAVATFGMRSRSVGNGSPVSCGSAGSAGSLPASLSLRWIQRFTLKQLAIERPKGVRTIS